MHRRESEAELRLKLTSMVARYQDMKTAFTDLKSQINVGLLQVYTLVLPFSIRSFDYDLILFVTNTSTNKKIQVEEVLASLAIPLMNLVGLKTEEMAQGGQLNTIIVNNNDFDHENLFFLFLNFPSIS